MRRWSALLRAPGAARMLAASLVGRLPYGIVPLALVLLVREEGHSYAIAGAVAGAYSLTLALSLPLISRLVDGIGLFRVLLPLSLVFPGALLLIVALTAADAVPGLLVGAAALAGCALPPLGATMRTQWQALVDDPGLREAAFALESVVQEITFVVGPLIVAVVAAAAGPAEALVLAGVACAAGTIGFVTAPFARAWRAGPRPDDAAATALAVPAVRTVALALVTVGVSFGVLEVTMPAFAEDHGNRADGGLALAAFSLGSMLGGIWSGARTWRLAVETRLMASLAILAGLTALLAAAGSVPMLALLGFVCGVPIAPTFAAAYRVIGERAPAYAATEAFGWTGTAIVGGVAIGSAAGGSLLDEAGTGAAFVAAGAVVLIAAVVTAARRRTLVAGSG